MHVLVVDIGGTHLKVRATSRKQLVRIPSGSTMTPRAMVKAVLDATPGWDYAAVSLGYPGPVLHGRIASEPRNLGQGWVGFNFEKSFDRPVRIVMTQPCRRWPLTREAGCCFSALAPGWALR